MHLLIYDYITRHNEFRMDYKIHFKKVLYKQDSCDYVSQAIMHTPIVDYRLNL